MCDDCKLDDFEGRQALIDWFGDPCFHDSEVIEIKLDREGPSHVHVHAWSRLKETDAKGCYVLDRHAVVKFSFRQISEVSLTSFGQNVIASLQVKRIGDLYRLTMEECIGVHGAIEGRGLSVALIPGLPKLRH